MARTTKNNEIGRREKKLNVAFFVRIFGVVNYKISAILALTALLTFSFFSYPCSGKKIPLERLAPSIVLDSTLPTFGFMPSVIFAYAGQGTEFLRNSTSVYQVRISFELFGALFAMKNDHCVRSKSFRLIDHLAWIVEITPYLPSGKTFPGTDWSISIGAYLCSLECFTAYDTDPFMSIIFTSAFERAKFTIGMTWRNLKFFSTLFADNFYAVIFSSTFHCAEFRTLCIAGRNSEIFSASFAYNHCHFAHPFVCNSCQRLYRKYSQKSSNKGESL